MVSSADHINIAAFQELQNALRVKKLNDELLEYLASSLRWLLHYSKKNHIPLPERDKIEQVIDRTLEMAEKLPRGMNETKKKSMSRC